MNETKQLGALTVFEQGLLEAALPGLISKVEDLTGKEAAFHTFDRGKPHALIISGNVRFFVSLNVELGDRALNAVVRNLKKERTYEREVFEDQVER